VVLALTGDDRRRGQGTNKATLRVVRTAALLSTRVGEPLPGSYGQDMLVPKPRCGGMDACVHRTTCLVQCQNRHRILISPKPSGPKSCLGVEPSPVLSSGHGRSLAEPQWNSDGRQPNLSPCHHAERTTSPLRCSGRRLEGALERRNAHIGIARRRDFVGSW
jgi:hypothetical protein